jgi:aryl-alcohol dehydrogenase-like predicted oxidoreductase
VRYVKLGTTGLDVSRLCLGCMSFGVPERGTHEWTLDEEASRPVIRAAVEAGINFFDTANMYSDGTSEEFVGRALAELTRRDETVIATKVFYPMSPGPNGGGLSRKSIMQSIDDSLRRLGTDYVDLYQIHRFDPHTPVAETMEALHDVVKAGKARYIGASSMWAWQFAEMQHTAERHGWTRFVSMQNHYNLLYREEEREMMPLCLHQGVGAIPWSPLARGRLTRPPATMTQREEKDLVLKHLYRSADNEIISSVAQIAEQRGVSMAQVALAWVAGHPAVSAPIVGVTSQRHLDDALAGIELELSVEERFMLEIHYTPQPVQGLS